MIWLFIADGVFIASIFLQITAVLSFLSEVYRLPLSDKLMPVLAAYHNELSTLFPSSSHGASSYAYLDVYIVGFIWIYLFFIKQARRAMRPYGQEAIANRTYAEIVIDGLLPIGFCGIAALLGAAILIVPALTLALALAVLIYNAGRKSFWFEISRSYYINLIAVAAGVTLLAALSQEQIF